MSVSIWRDQFDQAAFNIGTECSVYGKVRRCTLTDEDLAALYGDEVRYAAEGLGKFDVLTIDVESHIPAELTKPPY